MSEPSFTLSRFEIPYRPAPKPKLDPKAFLTEIADTARGLGIDPYNHKKFMPLPKPQRPKLSDMEIRCLSLLSQGFTQKEIASQLGVSRPAVARHVGSSSSTLAVKNGLQAVVKALAIGIIENPYLSKNACTRRKN